MKTYIHVITFLLLLGVMSLRTNAQVFYFGADLSYVNEMEDCGAFYKEDGLAKDPFTIFKDHGCNLVRLRTWHTPAWHDQLNEGHRYGDLNDIKKSATRAKAGGMNVLLDFHLSDTWADPSHQVIPAAWDAVVDDQAVLGDSLYQYIFHTLTTLGHEGLLPEIVQIGNETNKGILLSQEVNDGGWTLNWTRNAFLFQKAADAIKQVEADFGSDIKIALHIADPADVYWMISQFVDHGFTDFEIIGISYYWQWHQPVTITQTGQIIETLINDFPGKDVMIFETAYGWTTQNGDGANNILFNTHPSYSPLSPANQKKWMTDLTQTVIDHGGIGVVYWEPAWVSTSCETQWVTGSSWDNATFFDHSDILEEDGGIGWMTHPYEFTTSTSNHTSPDASLQCSYIDQELIIRNLNEERFTFPCAISLLSPDGKIILSEKLLEQSEDITRISVPALMPGCYFVSIRDKHLKLYTGKICVVGA